MIRLSKMSGKYLLFALLFFIHNSLIAAEVKVAVASNFLSAANTLAEQFRKTSGHNIKISSGSTGKIYAQIRNGAPYDVFLAANTREPERLEREGLVSTENRFTYAKGRLAVLASQPQRAIGLDDLKRAQRIALANPKLAPYGMAAQQVLQAYKIPSTTKKIYAENVAQAFLFVLTGNAPLGFVALSQIKAHFGGELPKGVWLPSAETYTPIEQQAVLLKRAEGNEAAQAYVRFLQSQVVQQEIQKMGYAR